MICKICGVNATDISSYARYSPSPISKTEILNSCVRKIKKKDLSAIAPANVSAVGTFVDDSPETVGTMG